LDNSFFPANGTDMDKQWRTTAWAAGGAPHNPWRTWLRDHGSLTRRLQAACADFRVRRLRQVHARPHRDEPVSLGLRPQSHVLVREVLLQCGDTPLVFAHTVIPLGGLSGPWAGLEHLGNRPLGAALFADPRILRHPLECRRLDARHPLYRAAAAHLPHPPVDLWARRSCFTLHGHSLLVTEVFLPEILSLSAEN
jgi:chorismate--pyruvate lyase